MGSLESRARGPKRVAKPRRNRARVVVDAACRGSLRMSPAAAPLVLARLSCPPKPPATQAMRCIAANSHACGSHTSSRLRTNRVFSHDATAAMLVSQNKEIAAMLVSQTKPLGIELYFYVNTLELFIGYSLVVFENPVALRVKISTFFFFFGFEINSKIF